MTTQVFALPYRNALQQQVDRIMSHPLEGNEYIIEVLLEVMNDANVIISKYSTAEMIPYPVAEIMDQLTSELSYYDVKSF